MGAEGIEQVGSRPVRVAFVASGGAAKGIAHLGVLRAAEELGIQFDLLVGTSAGALICSLYSQGISIERIVDSLRPPWRRKFRGSGLSPARFYGVALPDVWDGWRYLLSGVFSLDRLERFLRETLPRNDFREISRELYIVATDIDSTERAIFGRGYEDHVPVSQAVAASCCVPVLFRPFKVDGRYYVDGELKRTLSADIAIARGADVVVVSNVYNPRVTPKGERSIAQRGFSQVMRQMVNIVLHEKSIRGLDLYQQIYPAAKLVVIEPDVGPLSFFNHFSARKFLKQGYVEALRKLSAAKALGLFDGKEVPQAKLRAI